MTDKSDDDKPKNRGGAPTKYKPEFAEIAKRLCERGAIDTEVAEVLGIGRMTLYRWMTKHVEFSEAMKAGKEPLNRRLELTYWREALGYEQEREVPPVYDQKKGEWQRATYTEYVRPEKALMIFGMKNRLGWRDRVDHEHTGKDGGPIEHRDVSQMSDEEVLAELKQLVAAHSQPPQTH